MIDLEFKDDIVIKDGDFNFINGDIQNAVHLLQSEQGQFYLSPTVGVGQSNLINKKNTNTLGFIRDQLSNDRFRIKQLTEKNNKYSIDGYR
jgi:hypothetical protein